jgi:hypothetical protein
MRAILVGGLVLLLMSLGGGPAIAVPLAPDRLDAATSSPFLLSIRHHRHHHRHWRHWHSSGWGNSAPEAYPLDIDGQSAPMRPSADPDTASVAATAGHSAGASRPSIRWINPDRSTR